MKINKLTYMFVALLAMCISFTSCNDDDTRVFEVSAGEGIAGQYTGEWSKTLDGVTTTGVGTMIFTPSDLGGNYANITVKSTDLDIDMTSLANVTHANDDYVFTNTRDTNGFETSFMGRVFADGSATIYFQKTVKEGRKSYTYIFGFDGTR